MNQQINLNYIRLNKQIEKKIFLRVEKERIHLKS